MARSEAFSATAFKPLATSETASATAFNPLARSEAFSATACKPLARSEAASATAFNLLARSEAFSATAFDPPKSGERFLAIDFQGFKRASTKKMRPDPGPRWKTCSKMLFFFAPKTRFFAQKRSKKAVFYQRRRARNPVFGGKLPEICTFFLEGHACTFAASAAPKTAALFSHFSMLFHHENDH